MKRRLFLVRHAQSLSNVGLADLNQPDHSIPLTELGVSQALECGKRILQDAIPDAEYHIFSSVYKRAIQTSEGITKSLCESGAKVYGPNLSTGLRERRIDTHHLVQAELKHILSLPSDGKFFYGSVNIESSLEAAERMQSSIFEILNWSRKRKFSDRPMNLVLISHSHAIEAYSYLDSVTRQNQSTDFSDKIFPANLEGFGDRHRLKNAEYEIFNHGI